LFLFLFYLVLGLGEGEEEEEEEEEEEVDEAGTLEAAAKEYVLQPQMSRVVEDLVVVSSSRWCSGGM
jgi:hypothetical protein